MWNCEKGKEINAAAFRKGAEVFLFDFIEGDPVKSEGLKEFTCENFKRIEKLEF